MYLILINISFYLDPYVRVRFEKILIYFCSAVTFDVNMRTVYKQVLRNVMKVYQS